MFQPYCEILAHPGALAFSAAGLLARLPMSMVGIAIVLAVPEIYGSYGLAGKITAVYVIAHAACAPQLARLVDRYGQGRVMRPSVIVAAAGLVGLIVALHLHTSPWLLGVAVTVTGATIGSLGALVRARWNHVLRDPRAIHTAFSLESTLDELVFVVGPVVATILATNVAPTAGLWVPVVALLSGGMLLLTQQSTEPPVIRREPGQERPHMLHNGAMVVLVVVFAGIGGIFGSCDVATVAFAEEHGAKSAAGWVLAAMSLGSMLAGFTYGSRHWASPLWRRFTIGVGGFALGVPFFALVTNLPTLAAVMFVVGSTVAPTLINGNGLVQELVPHDQLTEGLAWIGTALGIGISVGAFVAGIAVDAVGSHGAFLVAMTSGALAVVAVVVGLRALTPRGRTSITWAYIPST